MTKQNNCMFYGALYKDWLQLNVNPFDLAISEKNKYSSKNVFTKKSRMHECLQQYNQSPIQTYISIFYLKRYTQNMSTICTSTYIPFWVVHMQIYIETKRISVRLLSVLRGHSVFHPGHNGQWPPTLKDFYTRSYPLHYFLILILEKEPILNRQ